MVITRLSGHPFEQSQSRNVGEAPAGLLEAYRQEHSFPVEADLEGCRELVPQVVGSLAASGTLWRHDPDKLAAAVLGLVEELES